MTILPALKVFVLASVILVDEVARILDIQAVDRLAETVLRSMKDDMTNGGVVVHDMNLVVQQAVDMNLSLQDFLDTYINLSTQCMYTLRLWVVHDNPVLVRINPCRNLDRLMSAIGTTSVADLGAGRSRCDGSHHSFLGSVCSIN